MEGWTPVTVSKVLHRFAPHAVPIVDSRVLAFYDVDRGQGAELGERIAAALLPERVDGAVG